MIRVELAKKGVTLQHAALFSFTKSELLVATGWRLSASSSHHHLFLECRILTASFLKVIAGSRAIKRMSAERLLPAPYFELLPRVHHLPRGVCLYFDEKLASLLDISVTYFGNDIRIRCRHDVVYNGIGEPREPDAIGFILAHDANSCVRASKRRRSLLRRVARPFSSTPRSACSSAPR